jgi:hypothetical protein
MNTRKLLLTLVGFWFALVAASFAQTQTTQATVARVTGQATVTLLDGTTTPLTAGMKVATGATINTGVDGEVYLESHAGYVTTIKPDSRVLVEDVSVTSENGKVVKENTTMDRKRGNLIALLDPKKKAVNNYQVRTPKGVAAARGTQFSVMFRGERVNVSVVGGVVSWGDNSIAAGNAVIDGVSTPLSEVAGENATLVADMVAAVAVAAANNIGGVTAADVAAVTTSVLTSNPALATEIGSKVQQFAPTMTATVVTAATAVSSEVATAVTTGSNSAPPAPTPSDTPPQAVEPITVASPT